MLPSMTGGLKGEQLRVPTGRKGRGVGLFFFLLLQLSSFNSQFSTCLAQDVMVTVTPVQQVLPPQVFLYIFNIGAYFNITLTNLTDETQDVYLGFQLDQTVPDDGLSISTPPGRQPSRPYSIPAKGVYQLSLVEMNEMFKHIPLAEVKAPQDLFTNYSNGSFGLLPEGLYQVHLTAYKWHQPAYATPQPASSPEDGIGFFNICYNAQAPKFLTPVNMDFGQDDSDIVPVDPLSPIFTWMPPVVVCNPAATTFEYSFTVVEMLPMQDADDAVRKGATFYKASGLTQPQCVIPQDYIRNMNPSSTYVAWVQAINKNKSGGEITYLQIENNGRSDLKLFRIKTSDQVDDNKKQEDDEEDDEEGNGDEEEDIEGIFSFSDIEAAIDPTKEYTYRVPQITTPYFSDPTTARKLFVGEDINVEWDGVYHLGGPGQEPDTLEFAYTVQLFNGGQVMDKAATLAKDPVFSKEVKEDEDYSLTIPWEDIEQVVNLGDYVVLRVEPKCVNGESVAFSTDTINVLDLAMAEHLAKKYFQCSSQITITNFNPTYDAASGLRDKVVDIGQYKLTIDEIKGTAEEGFEGKGRVEWSPMGFPMMVCVQFKNLKINTENRVYEGVCESYSNDPQSDISCVDKLFSDWGIDNLIGDGKIANAEYLQGANVDVARGLAQKIDLKKYYGYVKTGKSLLDLARKGSIDRLYMPLALPKDINSSPVDIQIAGMKFAPDHATMNIIGQFVLPESDYLENDILVLGCPRVCISPNSLLPEAGTLALLSDFTIKDPNTTYKMTFKAPQNLLQPTDGCYVAWKDDKLEIFGIDMEMTIPGLVKDVGGMPTDENPKLRIAASVEDWNEFMVDRVTMDPFQVEDLPGWTFTAQEIVVDMASQRNSPVMGAFPKDYDKKKAGIAGNDVAWQGCYIKEISVQFPTSMEFSSGPSSDDGAGVEGRRLKISATDMFFDKSGATLTLTADQILSASAQGQLGGWSFSLDQVGLSILQNDFKDCHFSGTFGVPVVEGKIGYSCQVMKLNKVDEKSKQAGKEFAYIFKVQQVDNLNFDFFLAKADINKKQTYLLVEALPEQGEVKTRVELMMGGVLDIGSGGMLKDKKLDFRLPGIVFSQFRIANCKAWESQFEDVAQMQKDAKGQVTQVKINGKMEKVSYLISNKEYEVKKDRCYISRGTWGLASPPKKLGPFELTLNSFNMEYDNDLLKLVVDGKVAIVQGIDLSAQAKLTIMAEVKNLDDFSKLSIKYKDIDLNDLVIKSTFAGCTFDGSLHQETGDDAGYSGNVKFVLPGEFLIVEASAAYYDYDDGKGDSFTWGFLKAKVGSKVGIEITPIKITSITGGFYFNCRRNDQDEKGATREKGLIGVVVGIGLSTTAGDSALKGDFEMTCIYDKNLNNGDGGLTSFVFNGHMEAVDGMVNADASIVYHHDNTDQYLALNVTVDAKADASELADNIQAITDKFQGKLDKLKEKGYKLVKDVKGSLDDKIGDNDGETEGDETKAKKPAEFKAGAEVTLDFRITMKEKGKKCTPVRWHLYLGNPESEQKRCRFTLIDFKSPVVSVNIGANAYLCIGNELPNNGKLPDIPYKVRKFLDGKSVGEGVQSASKSEADMARQKAMEEVLNQAASGCGVMLGATAYGYIDLDFGLLYGSFGATAGFDIALTKFKSPQWCANFKSNMGFHDWYGNGQLYASLEAELGLRLNLGFFNDSITILKAGLGGCFKFQGPKPSYFTGEARCCLSLFNGLVDIDRTYEFECGTFCKAFHGNPLDDFELFGDCMGYENTAEGWNQDKAINPTLFQNPILRTNAPINQHFRILDENELDRIEEKSGASRAALEAQASRTFVFKMNDYVEIRECNPYRDYKRYYLKGNISGVQHIIDLLELSPDKNYDMRVYGWAKEIVGGKEVNPVTFNEKTHKYENKAWGQWKHYYFRTGTSKSIEDIVDLQDYVAIAYPSYYNKLFYDSGYLGAHRHDIQYPLIALTSDLKGKAFTKGKLQWRWIGTDGTDVSRNAIITKTETDGTYCHIIADGKLNARSEYGTLKLTYTITKEVNKKTVYEVTELASLKLRAWDDTDWQSSVLSYEKPFVGLAPISISYNGDAKVQSVSDYYLVKGKKVTFSNQEVEMRLRDPYWYIAYLSNVVFAGGYEIDASRFNCYATTSQSVVYTDKGGKYEGKLSTLNSGSRCYSDYEKIRKLSWYQYDDYSNITPYPLPYYPGQTYNYVRGGNKRLPYFYPSSSPRNRFTNLLNDLRDVYYLCDEFQSKLATEAANVQKQYDAAVTITGGISNVSKWNDKYVGCYISSVRNNKRLDVPYYQLPLIWGATWGHAYTFNMYASLSNIVANRFSPSSIHRRAESEYGTPLFYRLYGGKGYSQDEFISGGYMRNIISNAKVRTYRVNSYDIDKGRYAPVLSINGAKQDYCGTVEVGYYLDEPLSYGWTLYDINHSKEIK